MPSDSIFKVHITIYDNQYNIIGESLSPDLTSEREIPGYIASQMRSFAKKGKPEIRVYCAEEEPFNEFPYLEPEDKETHLLQEQAIPA